MSNNKKWNRRRVFSGLAASIAAVGMAGTIGAAPAAAASVTGWVGPTAPAEGIVYLHSSTVTNAPALTASAEVWPSFGQSVPAERMGVQPRLFKSGALCKITNWWINPTPSSRFSAQTSGDCGPGSYNSHGFVEVWSEDHWVEYVTFPSNPLNYPAAAAAQTETIAETQENSQGQTFGSALDVQEPSSQPDLVLAIGTEGESGYVLASSLDTQTVTTVPLYESDGVTVIGSFEVG